MELNPDPNALALVRGDRACNYDALWACVAEFEGWLRRYRHAVPGERLPLAEADPEMLLVQVLACMKLGGIACPLNTRWPEAELAAAARRLNPRAATVFGTESRRIPACPPGSPIANSEYSYGLEAESEQPAVVIHTSGSSGTPKAAVLSFGNLWTGAENANACIPLKPGDRWLLSLPLCHVGGLGIVFRCLLAGAAMAIPGEDDDLAESLRRCAPTHVSLVATQLYRLVQDEAAAKQLATCKAVVLGGGPAPESLVREALNRGVPLMTSYGMTETAAMICCTRPGDPPERLLTSGQPLQADTVSIAEDGEIQVRGPQLFLGYVGDGRALDRPWTEDGWFRTGDLGLLDDAGYLHVTGRKDNRFISGGENVQPETIEQALRHLDEVEDAVVVPLDDEEWGQRPVAFVKMREGHSLNGYALDERLRGALAGYQIPRAFYAWPDRMAEAGLKVQRKAFEALARQLATGV